MVLCDWDERYLKYTVIHAILHVNAHTGTAGEKGEETGTK